VGVLAALAGAGALLCAGAVGLAHSPIVRTDVSIEPGPVATRVVPRGAPITGQSS
jgi:hypothetical protein